MSEMKKSDSRKPHVLVTHSEIPQIGISMLQEKCDVTICPELPFPTRDQILSRVNGVDALFWSTHEAMNKEVMDAAGPNLRAVSTMSAGYDHIDVYEAHRRGIKVGYTPHVLTSAVAEVAVTLLLEVTRRIPEGRDCVRAGNWEVGRPQWLLGKDIVNSTVGIVGLGGIGQAIAKRLKSFEISRLLYCGNNKKPEGDALGAEFVSFETLLRQSDFVIVSCPLNDATKFLFNDETFALMKRSAVFVNISRGGIVDQGALVRALESGTIWGAGLDVTTPEPLPLDHPLHKLKNSVISPHLGSATERTRAAMAELTARNILEALDVLAPCDKSRQWLKSERWKPLCKQDTSMASDVQIKLANERICLPPVAEEDVPRLFTPGEIISTASGLMRGHGTYTDGEDLKASVAGVKEQVNKLISIRPLKSRYNGEIGDVVVGRITEIQQKRWKVDTNSRLDSSLLLSSVNLPGGELRRRSSEDEKMMRKYLQEGDLISAEVMNVYADGGLSLHTRSLRYGKLGQGVLLKVFPSLVMRRKNHFHSLPCGAGVILGNNGFVWVCPTSGLDQQEESGGVGGFTQDLEKEVPKADREVIARLRNCILALASTKMLLYDTSIIYAYEESMKYTVTELLQQEVMFDIAQLTQHRLQMVDVE